MDNIDSDMFPITRELNGITSASHIRHELEAQYWHHCELFPRSLQVTHEIVDELRDIVLHSLGDLVASATSTVNFTVNELNHMLRLVDGVGRNVGRDSSYKLGGSSRLVGRFMFLFVRARVRNFHGEPNARLKVDQSVYGTVRKQTLPFKLLSTLFFSAPHFNLLGLYSIYTPGLVRHSYWAPFFARLSGEWQEFTLYGTVILAANVSFLAIQSVDQGGGTAQNRSPAQILSYLSTLTSVGGIVVRMLLLIGHQASWERVTAPYVNLEVLAIAYSLPYAMMIWSMLWFLAAFSSLCFQKSNLVARAPVAVLWVFVFVALSVLWLTGDDGRGVKFKLRWWKSRNGGNRVEREADGLANIESAETKPKQRKWPWPWPFIVWRKSTYDSERVV
ncbi:hypothetical protein B0H17DRAFT_1107361 [Mycena rosella]|uniref:Uncharacterized protein n=1 Tax=Mycena rosella TaxID=1033263 RepID=A0AAD7C0N1_MYCRO|nr:hypothetical protein B0H17DRAFT_1107361 [Mycena rosella]